MRGAASKWLVWGVALASGALASEAHAVVGYQPRYYAVINQPKVIPQNGVLAIGLENSLGGFLVTRSGALRGIRPLDGGSEPTGSTLGTVLEIGSRMQDIGWWAPDSPLAIGAYEVVEFEPELNDERLDTFEVAPALDDFELPPLEVASIELDALEVATMQVQCGLAGIDNVPNPMITLEYGIVPRLTAVLRTDAAPEVVSQHLFALHDPDAGKNAFYAPVDLTGEGAEFVVTFPEARESYCVTPSHFSFFTQRALALDAVCVDDDGTDWSFRVSASDAQIDEDLEGCDDPPPEFMERWCELHADEEWNRCDAAANPGTMPSPAPDPTSVEEPDPAPASDEEPDPAPGSDEEPDPVSSGVEEPDPAPGGDEEPDPVPSGEGLEPAGAESGSEVEPTDADPDLPLVPTQGAASGDAGEAATASKPVLVTSSGDAGGCALHPARTRASWAPLVALGLVAWMLQRRRARAA